MAKKVLETRDFTKNYASSSEFSATLRDNLLEIWRSEYDSRQYREQVWQESYRTWSIDQTDSDKSYEGMANLYVPQVRKEVETMSRRIFKGLLPEDYLKADGPIEFEDMATVNTQVVRHYYDKIIKIKSKLMPWIKGTVVYGTNPLRQFWRRDENEIMFKKRVPYLRDDGTIDFKAEVATEKVCLYDAPDIRCEDIFNTWVYPSYASDPSQIEMTFFRTKITYYDLLKKQEAGNAVGVSKLKDQGKDRDEVDFQSMERLQQFGETGVLIAKQDNKYYDLLEIWTMLKLPDTKYPVPCVVEIVNEQFVTRIQRNPYWHQRHPIIFGRFIIPPGGEFYGRGLPEANLRLQEQLNDTMNQTMDSATLALNNITIVNPAFAPNAESFEVEPNAVWWADPNGVKQFTFPDLTNTGYKAAGNLRSMISELSDNQPQLPDPIAGKARSTGQAELAVKEWQTDLFTIIDMIATEAMSELAYQTHALVQQFIKDDTVIRISGKYAGTFIERVVTPEMIVGRYSFDWIASLGIENQTIKTQQLLNFIKIYMSMPDKGQTKLKIDNLFVKILRDHFQIKDVENIISSPHINSSISPELEERILKLGGSLRVDEADNDDIHVLRHERAQAEDKDPLRRLKRSEHIQLHKEQKQKKALQAKLQQQALQIALAQGPQEGPKRQPGNPGQIPEPSSAENLQRGVRSDGIA